MFQPRLLFWGQIGVLFAYTVKPVYNGQPWRITKVVFVNRWPLFRNMYIYRQCIWICCSLCLNCRTHDMTGQKMQVLQNISMLLYVNFHLNEKFAFMTKTVCHLFLRCRRLHNCQLSNQNVDLVVRHNAH